MRQFTTNKNYRADKRILYDLVEFVDYCDYWLPKQDVLVIGGGIAGIQTSLDLTELGFKVFLVEKTPSIGGRMAQLDKTFPTLDCSLCILAPKMVEVLRNQNIELLTYHEVKKVSGNPGDFNKIQDFLTSDIYNSA